MDDVSTAQLTLAFVGSVTVSALLFLFIQAIKDFFPGLAGRAALGTMYALSLAIALAMLYQTGADWYDPLTYLAAIVVAISVAIVAKGIYAQVYQRQLTVTRARQRAATGATAEQTTVKVNEGTTP